MLKLSHYFYCTQKLNTRLLYLMSTTEMRAMVNNSGII